MTTCIHYKVSGRVQGVGFRAGTRARALSLGLSGWARNCADGGVEVLACGAAAQLEALRHWLHCGPPQAQVTAVTQSSAPLVHLDGFDIR
ncbi:MAG: acylphosphatase [Gammaproteobacteria bacterium]|nr:acylphosphatase [Gammaproteobacteria bacterium]